MSETRVMSSAGRGTAPAGTAQGQAAAAGGGRRRTVLLLAVLLVGGALAAWWFLLRPAPAEAAEEPEVEAGEVVQLEPVSINLAGEHYLKVALALELTAEVEEAVDGSKAQDAAISLFSGRDMAELRDPARREELKAELTETVNETYHGEVLKVYYTEYVMQ